MSQPQDFQNLIRFGTSSWTYPGWKGLVYHREYPSERSFRQNSLAEYAAYPLFTTVGIDSTFYRPPTERTLRLYAEQLPGDFLWASKVWERLTIPKFPQHSRYADAAGQTNSDFLNARLFLDAVLPSYLKEPIRPHVGPFIFQFPVFDRQLLQDSSAFYKKLDAFFELLPREFFYAVELRSPDLITPDYLSVLNRHGVTHVMNHWTAMPRLKDQMRAIAHCGGLESRFLLARLLTPLGVKYESAVKRFQPYSHIQAPNAEMRADVVTFIRRALERKVPAFILVNNRCEGCAPKTIEALIALANSSLYTHRK